MNKDWRYMVRPVGRIEKAARVALHAVRRWLRIKTNGNPVWLTESELDDLTRRLRAEDAEGSR